MAGPGHQEQPSRSPHSLRNHQVRCNAEISKPSHQLADVLQTRLLLLQKEKWQLSQAAEAQQRLCDTGPELSGTALHRIRQLIVHHEILSLQGQLSRLQHS